MNCRAHRALRCEFKIIQIGREPMKLLRFSGSFFTFVMDLKDEFYEHRGLVLSTVGFNLWMDDSCYLYDRPFGTIFLLLPMMAIMQQRVKSKKRRSLTWRPCSKGVDPSLSKIRCVVHRYQ